MPAGFPVEPAVRFFAELALLGIAGWYVFARLGGARQLMRLGLLPVAAFWLLMAAWLGVQLVDGLHAYYAHYTPWSGRVPWHSAGSFKE